MHCLESLLFSTRKVPVSKLIEDDEGHAPGENEEEKSDNQSESV